MRVLLIRVELVNLKSPARDRERAVARPQGPDARASDWTDGCFDDNQDA